MSGTNQRTPIVGSEKSIPRGARQIGLANPEERIEVTIILRQNPSTAALADEISSLEPRHRIYFSREEFAAGAHGAASEDMDMVQNFARRHGIEIMEASGPKRSVVVSGTIAQLSSAFGVELRMYKHSSGNVFRGREGPVFVPTELAPVIQAVLGLDNRPHARTHFRPLLPGQAPASSFTPPEIAKLYDYPNGLNGDGQCIGIIELGGGFESRDLATYFSSMGIEVPKIAIVSVDGGSNSPTGDPNGPDGEVMLDIEVAGSIASGAKLAVYFAPNTDRGFFDAVTAAVHDLQNKPSVISISWGSGENNWTAQAMHSLSQAFQDAATLGVTICVASGDGGSSDGETDGLPHVDFPASCPYALSCGGTRLTAVGYSVIKSETVWNDESQGGGATGGGVSAFFSLPTWQSNSGVPPSTEGRAGRGVPDVSGDAAPSTGYVVRVDGQSTIFGGTSAVAPLWASLIALMNQKLGSSLGFINPRFYEKLASTNGTFHDVTSGNNGKYDAKPGWDACTGLGSPVGAKLLRFLESSKTG
ncbi:MAG: S53 family peptidase [Nitrososphaerales archaeon]